MTDFPPGWAWLAAGVALLVIEMVTPGMFMMWLGLAALGTGALTFWLGLAFGAEVAVFGVLALAAIWVALRLRGRRRATTINAPGSGLIGRTAYALRFDGTEGRVRVGDSDWPARLAPGNAPPVHDAALRVVDVDGVVLIVQPGGGAGMATTMSVNGGT